MKPILFKSDATTFDVGIGSIDLATSCNVKENLNGTFELYLDMLKSDRLYNDIKIGSIICAKPNKTTGIQPFVVEQINKNIIGEISIFATHIGQHRSKMIPILPFEATSLSDAINKVLQNSQETNIFNFTTNKTVASNYVLNEPRSFRDVLGGKEGSLLDIYGGEYLFDNLNITLLNRRGKDDGLKVVYGHNMIEYNQEDIFDWSYSITGVLPFYKRIENETINLVVGDIQYSNNVGAYPYHKTVVIDFSEKFTNETPTKQQLNDLASEYLVSKGNPQIHIEVSFEDLSTLPMFEYLNRKIDDIELGDYVTIINSEYNVNITTRIRELDYDVLLDRYNTILIGDNTTTINDAIAGISSGTTNISSGVVYSAGSGIDITNNVIKNSYQDLNNVDLNDQLSLYLGYVSNATNTPTSNGNGYLIVVGSELGDRCMQIWRVRSSNNLWHRYYLNNAWSTWVQLQNV